MRGGYIRIHRTLADHRIWLREPFTMGQAWVDLLISANYKPSRVLRGRKTLEIRRGQYFTSIAKLSPRWKRDRKTVRAWLSAFAVDGMLDIETDSGADGGYTLLTILNYEKYQASPRGALDNGLGNAADTERDDGLDSAGDFGGDTGGDTSEEVEENYERAKKARAHTSTNGKPPHGPDESQTIRETAL